jgi:hypothetical protein
MEYAALVKNNTQNKDFNHQYLELHIKTIFPNPSDITVVEVYFLLLTTDFFIIFILTYFNLNKSDEPVQIRYFCRTLL